jgi:xanthine dehydrogenase iron-sulfur cluster and FAD-binding subunit A
MKRTNGANITTIEGLTPPKDGSLHPVQQAYIDQGATQCGFCTPGFLMTATALLRKSGPLDDARVRKAVAGNLCRCTGYQNIVNAIVEASGGNPQKQSSRQQSHAPTSGFIGAPVERAEDNELLTGKGVFVDDIDFPGMLHAHVVRSAHAHAKILCIETSEAKRSPGLSIS